MITRQQLVFTLKKMVLPPLCPPQTKTFDAIRLRADVIFSAMSAPPASHANQFEIRCCARETRMKKLQ